MMVLTWLYPFTDQAQVMNYLQFVFDKVKKPLTLKSAVIIATIMFTYAFNYFNSTPQSSTIQTISILIILLFSCGIAICHKLHSSLRNCKSSKTLIYLIFLIYLGIHDIAAFVLGSLYIKQIMIGNQVLGCSLICILLVGAHFGVHSLAGSFTFSFCISIVSISLFFANLVTQFTLSSIGIPHLLFFIFLFATSKQINDDSILLYRMQSRINIEHFKLNQSLQHSESPIAIYLYEAKSNTLALDYHNSWNVEPFNIADNKYILALFESHGVEGKTTVKTIINQLTHADVGDCPQFSSLNIIVYKKSRKYHYKVNISVIPYESNKLVLIQYINNTNAIELTEVKTQNKMMCSITHELLNPLNTILAIVDKKCVTDTLGECYSTFVCSISLLHLKIRDFISFAEIKAGKLSMACNFIDIRKVITNVVSLYAKEAEAKEISIQYRYDPKVPRKVHTDHIRVMQLISNMVSNSVKFTNSSGKITISLAAKCHAVYEVSVEDNGIGFDSRALEDNKLKGIGMIIMGYICEQMGTKLKYSSVIGKNTIFSFEIVTKGSVLEDIPDEQPFIDKAHIATVDESSQVDAVCIIVVDDMIFNRSVMKMLLMELKIRSHIFEACNGLEAVVVVKQCSNKFGRMMVFMDVDMPLMDGLKATVEIRSVVGRCVWIIGVTAFSTAKELQSCKDAGMDEAYTKPMTLAQLQIIIRKFI